MYRHGVYRNRESFPTRRSSDLINARDEEGHVVVALLVGDALESDTGRQIRNLNTGGRHHRAGRVGNTAEDRTPGFLGPDRKSTRLNSSHSSISYAVFCLKKKNR